MSAARYDGVYLPSRLKDAMKSILTSPLTLITAGAGYGKTTAVSCFLEKLRGERVCRWYTCFGEPPERAWSEICTLLSSADPRAAEFLGKISLPTLDSLGHISLLMDSLACGKETILVIDNYQLAGFPAPCRLLDALSAHHCENLRLVVLSHPIPGAETPAVSSPRIRRIRQEVFCFRAAEIQTLFARSGAPIPPDEAGRLERVTEGWIAALRLYLAHYLSGGALHENVGIGELMERVFWRPLDGTQREFFLGLSLLDTFTEAQACRVSGGEVPAGLWSLVLGNPFVRRAGNGYTLHSLLKAYLSDKMLARSDAFHRMMWDRAGEACAVQGKNVEALLFFIRAGDDGAALSVPLNSLQLAELVRTKPDELTALLSRCPIGLLAHRWQLLLGAAIKSSLNGKIPLARTAIARLTELRDRPGAGPRQEAAAALELIASFQAFNDVRAMCRHHAAVCALLDDPRDFYLTNDAWTFGIPSVVYMFWREPGELAGTLRQVEEGIPRYAVIAGGKGLGAPEAMAAEVLLLSGDDNGCQAAARRAKFIAAEHGQDSVWFCALTLLARAALQQGDAGRFSAAARAIGRRAFEGTEFRCVTASEVCLGYLYFLLDLEEKIPGWLFRMEAVRRELYPVSLPFAHVITLRWLRRHRPEEFPGAAEAFLQESRELRHLLPMLYIWLERAVWDELAGSRTLALEGVGRVLSHALPNQVSPPLAEYYGELSGVLEDPALPCADPEGLARVRALGRRFVSGAAAVRAALLGLSPLTPREREIALLARQRLSTREIARRLTLSPATVRNTLSSVYGKLHIRGKGELSHIQF